MHIDFGDCFEVAMHREKYPEKIPFRLTRMLINAMEVAGVDGTFTHTSVNVMRVLRKNRDSLMAILEAFVHDPLINWRLVDADALEQVNQTKAKQPKKIESAYAFDHDKKDDQDKFSRSVKEKQIRSMLEKMDGTENEENNKRDKAMAVIKRIRQKLEGTEFQDMRLPTADTGKHPATVSPQSFADKMREEEKTNKAKGLLKPTEDPTMPVENISFLHTYAMNSYSSVHSRSAATGSLPHVNKESAAHAHGPSDVTPLTVGQQVDKLIAAATSHENLCQCYIGWCPFW